MLKDNPVVLRADLLKELRRMTPLQRSFAMNWLAIWMDDLSELHHDRTARGYASPGLFVPRTRQ